MAPPANLQFHNYDSAEVFKYLTLLDWQLSEKSHAQSEIDYPQTFETLQQILNVFCGANLNEKSTTSEPAADRSALAAIYSPNVSRMLAKTLNSVLKELPNRAYDLANQLVNHVAVDDDGTLSPLCKVACLVLADIMQHHPLQVNSLIDYTISQVYKILKKDSSVDHLVVYLMSVLLSIALKSDVSDKTASKLDKIFVKTITQSMITGNSLDDVLAGSADDTVKLPSVALIIYYIGCLKYLMILQTTSHYEQLLKFSASATSGSKMKPEALMSLQHQYQQGLLLSHEKVFQFGFKSQFSEVRSATVDLVAHVLLNFVATESFNASEYLIGLYPLPPLNLRDPSMIVRLNDSAEPIVDVKLESNTLLGRDSQSNINRDSNLLLFQIGVVESLMFYLQLELLQSSADRPLTLTSLVDAILRKFGESDHPLHVENQQWERCLLHWSSVLRHVITELGSTCHEVLTQYLVAKFSQSADINNQMLSKNKRESIFFGFGGSKSSKGKDVLSGRINLKSNAYQIKLMLDIVLHILPYGVDFDAASAKTLGSTQLVSDDVNLAEEEEDASTSKKSHYISTLLISFLASDSESVRKVSLQALVLFSQISRTASNQIILDLFQIVNHDYNHNSADDKAGRVAKLFYHALALLALIKQSKITLLQNSTIAQVLSFCTQNLKNTNGLKNLKSGACWIILTSLVTLYRDSEFVKVNSSQFLVFWKNLLTSQFVTSGLGSTDTANMPDILCNLKLRTLSIACLLNYILALDHSPELSRQLQFFLVKSHKYLLYLESSIESVGLVTSLNPQAFNACDLNINVIGNFLFSNAVDSEVFSEENQLISLILYNKKLILQGFVKLAHYLKSDVNSSLVVFLLKVFADPKGFSRHISADMALEKLKSTKKVQQEKVAHASHNLILLEEEYNYNFGVTSKFELDSSVVDELCLQIEVDNSDMVLTLTSSARTILSETSSQTATSQLSEQSISSSGWLDPLERQVFSSSIHSIHHDPLTILLGRYSYKHIYSPSLVTSLVDLSIELFVLVFPSLSYKIQFSLLEQLMASATAKNVDPLRKQALTINLAVALHTLFKSLQKRGHTLDESLVQLSLDILDMINSSNKHLVTILAEAIGLASMQLPKNKSEEYVSARIAKIVDTVNPLRRGLLLLAACKVYQHSHVGFLEIYSVTAQLLRDPHPVMALYTLRAAATLLGDATGKQGLVKDIFKVLHDNFLAGYYGVNLGDHQWINLRFTHRLNNELLNLLKIAVTTLGPSIKEFDDASKANVFQILYASALAFDCADQTETITSLHDLSSILQEILVFDIGFVPYFTEWFRHYSEFLIVSNIKMGVATSSPLYLDSSALFAFTTSNALSNIAFASLVEMTKLGVNTLNPKTLDLAWISMELNPCASAKDLLTFWVDMQPQQNWFARLNGIFRVSSRKLVGPFLEQNYEQKMLPILQREKKKSISAGNFEFRDEEVEGIVDVSGSVDDKNQPISWEFKLLIYDLVINVLTAAENSELLLDSLKPRIQELIRLSFLGTTTPILALRLRGIQLLDKTLSLVGELEDPLYPDTSILEQQQAQIISALIPCFDSDSNPNVIVAAITVSSKFINLPRIKFYSKQRILNTMIYLLEEISSGKFLKFVFLESMAEYSKKSIQLAILNCWAVLKLRLPHMDEDSAKELREILTKYSRLLILLWILVLKDLSTLRYSQPDTRELDLYQRYWLNFIAVLSSSLESDNSLIRELLQDENGNFFFVMFCQCLEALIRGSDVSKVLDCVIQLLKIPELTKALLDESLFEEVIDSLDRLVLMETDIEVKCKVIEVVQAFFEALVALEDADVKKLLEVTRVTMLPLFETFPFLRQDYDPENMAHQLSLKRCTSPTNLLLAKTQMTAMVHMVQKFPASELPDLLSCVLYIFAKFFEFGNSVLIGSTLPYLKTIIGLCNTSNIDLIDPFFQVVRCTSAMTVDRNQIHYLVTMMILATGSNVSFTQEEIDLFASALVSGLLSEELAATCVQSIKALVAAANNGHFSVDAIVKLVIRSLLVNLLENDLAIDTKLALEIVLTFLLSSVVENEEKVTAVLTVVLPLMIEAHQQEKIPTNYLQSKIMGLIGKHPHSFKTVVTAHLDDTQKNDVETLVKAHDQVRSAASETTIELKTFDDDSETGETD